MGAKTDVVVKLVLVFFISLLSFSIGTFVGKKYSDNQHKLSALEPGQDGHGSREVASAHGDSHGNTHGEAANTHGGGKTGDSMSDEEIAKLAEEFVADDTTAVGAHGTNSHGEAPAAHGKETEHKEEVVVTAPKTRTLDKAEPLAAAKNIAHGKAPTAPVVAEEKKAEKDTRIPSSIPKDVGQYSAGKFTVQVGSYAKEDEAQKIAGDLKAKGFSAFYIPATVKGQTWYRVSVGLFATPKEAQDYRTELMSKAKLSSALVQKIVQ
ncbi:SPOR domain-containing protein [Bdellovibrio sp. HCB337]|uniref:SPOR domain-containing protein n=1 Tax=Bdellovibrio sp. HCB337 TaxID=3394358 RepID=UPI0039A52A43